MDLFSPSIASARSSVLIEDIQNEIFNNLYGYSDIGVSPRLAKPTIGVVTPERNELGDASETVVVDHSTMVSDADDDIMSQFLAPEVLC